MIYVHYFRNIDDIRQFDVQPTFRELNVLADERGFELPQHEFHAETPHMRNARRPHVDADRQHCRVNSLELLNRCFYQAGITENDLLRGQFTVTCRFEDFHSGRVILSPIDIRVPEGSRYNTFPFFEIFEDFCDKTEEVPAFPHGKAFGNEITHDMRVNARRFEVYKIYSLSENLDIF